MTRALIVDDERPLLRALSMNLTARQYEVTEAATGTEALTALALGEFDVILLDLGLPDISGLDVIRAVRQHSTTPIIVLSARTGSDDKVSALDLGADDYVTKPFSIDELLARLRAATRRATVAGPVEVVRIGDVEVDLGAKIARDSDGGRIHLTPTEWQLLEILLRNPEQADHRTGVAHRGSWWPRTHRSQLSADLSRAAASQARAGAESAALPGHRARHGLPLPTVTFNI